MISSASTAGGATATGAFVVLSLAGVCSTGVARRCNCCRALRDAVVVDAADAVAEPGVIPISACTTPAALGVPKPVTASYPLWAEK